jgi:GNAT superfamily N-acetyltransferase
LEREITIVDYEPKHHDAFRAMNVEWLDKYDLKETHDLMVLDDPQGTILDRGGYIWIAIADGVAVGSAALMKEEEENVFELAKMAVLPAYQGRGISRKLIEKCLEKARVIGAKKLILFSNHQLETAISLYKKYGFRHVEVTHSPFVTADVRMELEL